jgi:hypothetical protein
MKLKPSNEVNVILEYNGIYSSTSKLIHAKKLLLFNKSMLLSKVLYLEVGGNPIGIFNPHGSIVVVMKTFFPFPNSFLEWVSFYKTTFQPGFFKFLEKNYLHCLN